MATFKICVRKQRNDGFYPVYIRVSQGNTIAYIKTDKAVTAKYVKKSEVTDPYVIRFLSARLVEYMERMNRVANTSDWKASDIVDYLKHGDEEVCFSDYARTYHDRMFDRGERRNARNYELAYQHMERYAGTNRIMFSHLTSTFVNGWLRTLEQTHRAKEMYPVCIRQIFKEAVKEYNDYDTGVIRIKTNPWVKVKIPKADKAEQLAITPEACREFFAAPIPESKLKSPLAELGHDVAMLVLCLGGMNTVDIFNLRKQDYDNGIISYQRAKTKKFRADGAYMEMRVPPILVPIVEKYLSHDAGEPWLFTFHQRHSNSDSFNANVNIGIKRICASMGMEKKDWYCVYTFRHTWGTVAQNDCNASMDDVAFGMNHSSGYTVTRGYVKVDFKRAWLLNEKVVDLIFFTEKISSREIERNEATDVFERFSSKQQIRGSVFFRGKLLGEFTDIGYNNVDEVIQALVPFVPDSVPDRSMVLFKVDNLDKGQSQVYPRMKGKSF